MPKLLFNPDAFPELTYQDVALVPHNSSLDYLLEHASTKKLKHLRELYKNMKQSRSEVIRHRKKSGDQSNSALEALQQSALTSLMRFESYVTSLGEHYPHLLNVPSRDAVDFTPLDGIGNTPIVIANMKSAAGKRSGEAAGRMGSATAFHQDMTDKQLSDAISYMHSIDLRYMTPVTVTPETTVSDFHRWVRKRDVMGIAVVVDDGRKFLGIMSEKDIPKSSGADDKIPFKPTEDVLTAEEGISPDNALKLMNGEGQTFRKKFDFLPIVRKDGTVAGVLTRKAAAMQLRYKNYEDKDTGGIAVVGTVAALNGDPVNRIDKLIQQQVKALIFDTAHFDNGRLPLKNLEMGKRMVEASGLDIQIIAGNVVTREGVRRIIGSGGDIAKVGVGPGRVCSTRRMTGVGRPQFTAVFHAAEEAKIYGKYVWADGGIDHPRDIAIALAAGASQVMIGSKFAGTLESPGDLKGDAESGWFKENFGMASERASTERGLASRANEDLEAELRRVFRENVGHRSEGVESKAFVDSRYRSVADKIHYWMDGVTSAMTYSGSTNLREFKNNARIAIQNPSGFVEGEPK